MGATVTGSRNASPGYRAELVAQYRRSLKGSAVIERTPVMEGKMMSMIVSRAPGWEPPKKQAPAPAKKPHANQANTAETTPTSQAAQAAPTPAVVPEDQEATAASHDV